MRVFAPDAMRMAMTMRMGMVVIVIFRTARHFEMTFTV